MVVDARSGKGCLVAKDSRIHADRPRHPWRGRFALQAYLSFPVGLMHRFEKQESGHFYRWVIKTIADGCWSKVRKGMPGRNGFPHPCGSATPSLARTLCSSGMPFLPGWADASL